MLPSIELLIAAIFASIVLMTGGFWLISNFWIAKTSTSVRPRGALPLDSTLIGGSENKQVLVLTSPHGVNETSLAVYSPNTGASHSKDTDQSIAARPGPTPAAAPAVAVTEDVAAIINGPGTSVDAAITSTASAHGRPVGAAITAENTAPDSTVSAVPSRITHGRSVAADSPTEADTAGKLSPSRVASEVTASDPPSIAAKTRVPSLSQTVGEESALAAEKRVAPNPSNATSVDKTAFPATTDESLKATIVKKSKRRQRPRSRTRRPKMPRRPRARP
jgi:hypothetical protein